MPRKYFRNIVLTLIGLLCSAGYSDQVTDLVTRLEKLEPRDTLRAEIHLEDRVSKVQDEKSKLIENADFILTVDANVLTLSIDGQMSDNRLFREFTMLRAGQLAHYAPHLARELKGLKIIENKTDEYLGIPCKLWHLKSELKESKFGIKSTTIKDVELWIDANGYPIAASFKSKVNGRMLLFKFNSESARQQRYQRLGERLVLIFDKNVTDVKSKAGEQKRTITTTVKTK